MSQGFFGFQPSGLLENERHDVQTVVEWKDEYAELLDSLSKLPESIAECAESVCKCADRLAEQTRESPGFASETRAFHPERRSGESQSKHVRDVTGRGDQRHSKLAASCMSPCPW